MWVKLGSHPSNATSMVIYFHLGLGSPTESNEKNDLAWLHGVSVIVIGRGWKRGLETGVITDDGFELRELKGA